MTDFHAVLSQIRAGQWDAAHAVVQEDDSPRAAWLHGILHIQERDLDNAAYWYRRAGRPFGDRGSVDEELARFEAELPPS